VLKKVVMALTGKADPAPLSTLLSTPDLGEYYPQTLITGYHLCRTNLGI
jgi:hypothetical protein